jgi:hypothetical protein
MVFQNVETDRTEVEAKQRTVDVPSKYIRAWSLSLNALIFSGFDLSSA